MATDEQTAYVAAVTETNARIEAGLNDAAVAIVKMIELYEQGAKLNMKGATGSFIVKERAAFRRAIGLIGEVEEIIYPAHIKATAIARNTDASYDAPENYVTLLGGGR